MIIQRVEFEASIDFAFRNHKVVALLGPRQCGKTTLAKQYLQQQHDFNKINYFDLEDPTHLNRLQNPKTALMPRKGLIVFDEIQLQPELFPILRVLVDDPEVKQRYLILGSASRDLIKQSSETLAGRIRYLELTPFNFHEVDHWKLLWLRGGFPLSYLASSDEDSWDWRQGYISTFLERDIPNLGFQIPATMLRRFWLMLSHYHGNIFNASELGRSLGIADTTARRYLDILSGTFMVRQLQPWFENINKRQVKLPKIYFRDSGILHSLIGIKTFEDLINHPKLGASWEGIALEEIIRHYKAVEGEAYFWAIHSQAELDLLIIKNGKKIGFEIKYSETPKLTKSMRIAQELLQLDELIVVIPGDDSYLLTETVQVKGINALLEKNK